MAVWRHQGNDSTLRLRLPRILVQTRVHAARRPHTTDLSYVRQIGEERLLDAGLIGTGSTGTRGRRLYENLDLLIITGSPFSVRVGKPETTRRPAEIGVGSVAADGLLSEAVFKHVRDHLVLARANAVERTEKRRRRPPASGSAHSGNPGRPGEQDERPQTTKRKTGRRPLLVIDGDSFAHRSYHALPKTIQREGGGGGGAIVGFANAMLRLYEAERPRAVLVAWDTLEVLTERHEKLPGYQGGREFDDALIEQLDILPRFVAACGFANAKAPGYEADDFLAAAVAAEELRGGRVLVASGDRDTFQLASEATTILFPVRAGEMARIGPAEVRERYGVDPKQVPDFIALRGDPSDKIPGARDVGPKGAANLLSRYGSLDEILSAGRFPTQAKALRLYRSIATMNASAPIPALPDQMPTWSDAAELARTWGLNQLANRLAEWSPPQQDS